MSYRPAEQFNVPMLLLNPTWETVNGVAKKTYPKPEEAPEDSVIYGSFKTFGGTKTENNGIIGVENTAKIATWYRPDIKADSRIVLLQNNAAYELMGDPENIEMRNQFMEFSVKRAGGKN